MVSCAIEGLGISNVFVTHKGADTQPNSPGMAIGYVKLIY
jgi:hypothetical protein